MCGNMISSCKMTPWLMAIFCLVTAGCLNVTDQQTSESQHDHVAILKQLRKVNDDGSYTFGYEAGDGSFKVETRDVLGNVKGTFGFVDGNGEIKRVTYSSSNGTGFKATTVSPLQDRVSVVQSIPRVNRSSTRKPVPSVIYATSTESSSSSSTTPKLTVVQSIPRTRTKTTTASSTTSTTTESAPKTLYGHYIKGSKYRPRVYVNGQQRPSSISIEEEPEDSQITRPSLEAKQSRRKTLLTKRPIDHNLRPITEEFDEKSEETKSSPTGNNLRRQLQPSIKAVEETEENTSDEHSDVYGGSLSTTRPLFTTSSAPKILHRLQTERPKMLYPITPSSQENMQTTEYDNAGETTSVYEGKVQEDRETTQQFILRPLVSRVDHRESRAGPEPVYVRREPEQILRDLQASGILVPASTAPESTYRVNPIDRILSRLQARPSLYPAPMDAESEADYPADAPAPMDPPEPPIAPMRRPSSHLSYVRSRPLPRVVPYVTDHEGRARPAGTVVRLQTPLADREYVEYPYRSIVLPPEPPNPIAPPLSRRDFQILLRRLLVSQYGVRALSHPRTYLDDALYDQQTYPAYSPTYSAPTSRHPLVYNDPMGLRYGERMVQRGPALARTFDPSVYPSNQYPEASYQDPVYAKRVYRQKIYEQDVSEEAAEDTGDEILPPPVREALLLRMLQLAITNDKPNFVRQNSLVVSPTSSLRKSAPIRSVQIITDEKSEEKDNSMRKKM